MSVLARLFDAAGCSDVETYIQSGNVIFRSTPETLSNRVSAVTRALGLELGAEIPIVVRSADEFRRIRDANPYLARGVDPASLHVMLLRDRPAPADARKLEPDRSPGDGFEVRGAEIYLHLPRGAARTKLTNDWFDRALKTRSTLRNWRTVLALCERLER